MRTHDTFTERSVNAHDLARGPALARIGSDQERISLSRSTGTAEREGEKEKVFRLYLPDELGPDGYPYAWHRGVKHLVREQAHHRCVRCLHPYVAGTGEWSPCDERCDHHGPFRLKPYGDGEWEMDRAGGHAGATVREGCPVEARWRVLTVHHLNGQKHDLRWWNLAALCQRCHLQIQGRVVMERIWPWPHTPWFRPYAAGWYAHAYLGEDLTREQVEARLDELLALEEIA